MGNAFVLFGGNPHMMIAFKAQLFIENPFILRRVSQAVGGSHKLLRRPRNFQLFGTGLNRRLNRLLYKTLYGFGRVVDVHIQHHQTNALIAVIAYLIMVEVIPLIYYFRLRTFKFLDCFGKFVSFGGLRIICNKIV